MLNIVKIKKQMLNNVKIFLSFVCECEVTQTGKVDTLFNIYIYYNYIKHYYNSNNQST